MAENTKIEWTDATFNPWRGCQKVSPGCERCYAETMSGRNPKTLGMWGPNGTRVVAAEAQWKLPLKWNREAKEAGERHRVFCASLADIFEDWQGPMSDSKGDRLAIYEPNGGLLSVRPYAEDPGPHCRWLTMQDVRRRLFSLIDATPNLDWLILTKRPENIVRMLPSNGMGEHVSVTPTGVVVRNNVWIGTSVENQEQADKRIPHLLQVPAAVRFLSCEPLLGPVDLRRGVYHQLDQTIKGTSLDGLHWVIVGGESGHGARPCQIAWIENIVAQCKAAGVACFVKQLGSRPADGNIVKQNERNPLIVSLKDKKGGAMEEWPADLRVREFPKVGTS